MKRGFSGIVGVLLVASLWLVCSTPVQAQGQWRKGEVTARAWADKYRRIEINDVVYTLMPDAGVYRRVKTRSGIFQQPALPLHKVGEGQKVEMLAQGHRIYQLVVVPSNR